MQAHPRTWVRLANSNFRAEHLLVRGQCLRISMCLIGLCFSASKLHGAALAAPISEHWTQFRGPHQNGSLNVDFMPLTWSTDSNIVWKAEVEGGGNSS